MEFVENSHKLNAEASIEIGRVQGESRTMVKWRTIENVFTEEFILNFPKTIDSNECWIPPNKPSSSGYVTIEAEDRPFYLHRVSMCVFHYIRYDDLDIYTRHAKGCNKACFNPNHLQPGTSSESQLDNVEFGTHPEAKKTCCPECGGPYSTTTCHRGRNKGLKMRYCRECKTRKAREKREANGK